MAQALAAPIHLFDYLAFDDASALRHEYVGGRRGAVAYNASYALPEPVPGVGSVLLDTLYNGTDVA